MQLLHVQALTGTESLAAAYEFTTLTAVPGTLTYRGAKIQVVDLPGIIEGAKGVCAARVCVRRVCGTRTCVRCNRCAHQ